MDVHITKDLDNKMTDLQRKVHDQTVIIGILVDRLGGEVEINAEEIAKVLLDGWVVENGPGEERHSFYIKIEK